MKDVDRKQLIIQILLLLSIKFRCIRILCNTVQTDVNLNRHQIYNNIIQQDNSLWKCYCIAWLPFWNLEWDRRDRILLMTIHLSFLLLFASTNPLGFSDENIVITY